MQAAAQVLGGFSDVAAEFLDGELAGFVDVALGAGADIGHLGLGAHPAVFHLGQLGFEGGDALGGGLHQRLGRLRGGIGGVRGGLGRGGGFGVRIGAHGGFS